MENNKSVLIAGGTGFVGEALVEHLLGLGYRVKVMTRNIEKAKTKLPPEVQFVKWPSKNEKLLLPKNQNCYAFINLTGENVGQKRWTLLQKRKLLNSRLNSVEQLYQIVKQMENPPKVWIQASAIGIYGSSPAGICTENSNTGSGFLAEITQNLEEKFNALMLPSTRKVILRLGIVMHPKGGFLQKINQSILPGIRFCPGNGQNKLSWIHLTDLLRLIETCITNPNYSGHINATTPYAVTTESLIRISAGTSIIMLKIPAFVLRLILGVQKTNELVLANQNVYPNFLMDNDFGFFFPVFTPEIFDT